MKAINFYFFKEEALEDVPISADLILAGNTELLA